MISRKDPLQIRKVTITDGANLSGCIMARVEISLEIQIQHRETIPAGSSIPIPLSFSCQVEFLQSME